MRGRIALTLAIAVAPVPALAERHVCGGSASDPSGARVLLDMIVDPSGKPGAMDAWWYVDPQGWKHGIDTPTLNITYRNPTMNGVGKPDEVDIITAPENEADRNHHAVLSIGPKRWEISLGQNNPFSVAFTNPWGEGENIDLVAALDGPGPTTLSVRLSGGHRYPKLDFAVDPALRDRLYRQALAEARAEAAAPGHCRVPD